ncbi:hypothetical protein PQO03_16675 [Lentisphaera profundi]|uniref:O-antigen ligase-related domain-containing protein n=1 Tax=Lentisphaera profundi TaxID=1658616 RepID=A0ABY7VW15_9BACT|nr:O-antigen ligase family protein [Lentisphaera profundi]WDE97463.1 hypothetical protein PQO03_16675 [Lentisphaera profundi]
MISLLAIILSVLIIHICGGGLMVESLFASSFILNLSALHQSVNNHKQQRVNRLPLTICSLCLIFSIAFFFLPLFNTNQNNASYYYQAQNLLTEGSVMGFFDLPDFSFRNTLHFINSLSILILIINLIPLIYLTANLERKHKLYLAYVVVIMGIFNILAVLYQQQIRDTAGYIWWFWDSRTGKSFASFVNPNHFGAYCAALLSIPTCQFLTKSQKKEYKYLAVLASLSIALIIGIMLSGSMGAYLLGMISLTCSYLFCSKQKSSSPTKTFFILMVVIAFSILTPLELEGELNERGINDDVRKDLFATVPKVIQDFPLGIGPGSYGSISPSYTGAINKTNHFHHSENTYFNIIQEFGIIFFILLIILNGFYLQQVFENLHKKKISKNLAAFSTVAIIIFICHASYDYGLHIPIYAFHIAIFYGLMLCKGSIYTKEKYSKAQLFTSKVIIIFPLFFVLLSAMIWLKFNKELKHGTSINHTISSNANQISENITYAPVVWHQWFFLGLKILEKDQDDFLRMDFSEKCFRTAAHYSPTNQDCWYMLFAMRDQLGRTKEAQDAYLFYFKLLNSRERSQHKSEAMDILQLTENEFERIKFLEHTPMDYETYNIRRI